jgi:hypothetical protein
MFSAFTDLPRLYDYASAVRHYNKIVPLRGSDNVRPICLTTTGRRKKHLTILESTVLGCKAISCRLYTTDVLSFLEDGRVHIDNSYASSSTNSFVSQILCGIERMSFHQGNVWIGTAGMHWLVGRDLILVPRGDGWIPETPHKVFRSFVNRKAMNVVTKPYKPFINHCRSILKVVDPHAIVESSRAVRWNPTLNSLNSQLEIMLREDRQGWGDLTVLLISQSVSGKWQPNWNGGVFTNHFAYSLNEGTLMANIREMLRRGHASEVCVLEEAPLGELITDPNPKATEQLRSNSK